MLWGSTLSHLSSSQMSAIKTFFFGGVVVIRHRTTTTAPAAPVGPTYRLSQKASRFLAIPARMESPLLGSRDNMAISQTALVASVQKSDSSEGYVRCNPAAALQY
jgi:hypothetical protein